MAPQRLTYENVVYKLLEAVPDLQEVYNDHLRGYDELIPHVFFGDLTRYVIACFQMGPSAINENAATILNLLEMALTEPDSRLQELVSVSFLENLHQAGETYTIIKNSLRPNLRKELSNYEHD